MIKIIKAGTRRVAKCETCGCQFSYESNDIKAELPNDFKNNYDYVECPQCYDHVIVMHRYNKIIDDKKGIFWTRS